MKSKNSSAKRIYLIAIGSILILSVYFTGRDYYDTLKYKELDHLDELRTVANTLASFINGDDLALLMSAHPDKDDIATSGQDSIYISIHRILLEAYQANKINSPIYTLTLSENTNDFYFGVTSASKPYFRHKYDSNHPILLEKYTEGGVIPAYSDKHGYWMSAFAPIKNSKGKVIAVVEVDNFFEDFKKEANQGLWENVLISILVTSIIGFLLYGNLRTVLNKEARYKKQIEDSNKLISAQNDALAIEKERSDKLLLNVLPLKIADELKARGKVEPVLHESVTVVFTDFTGFTQFTETLTPQELIEELNVCFSAFDQIVQKYKLEKLKTIGDAYMFAGGIPEKQNDNSTCCLKASIEMVAFIKQRHKEKTNRGIQYFDIKVGMHTGNVVAGVVGKDKFIYDIWGDAVNIAARMESTCEGGKINVSETVYELERSRFNFTARGEIQAKNKGLLKMYYLAEPS